VVQVYDYGEADGEAFIVMEFVDGETLKAALDRPERLPLARAVEIMRGVLMALEMCHRLAVVHRDIKPSNIMLPADGGVKLADFGIARIENSELTIAGTVMGTPPYMSPEQFTARDPVEFQSDIWSCGVMFYEMLTGSRPFAGKTMAVSQRAGFCAGDPVGAAAGTGAGRTGKWARRGAAGDRRGRRRCGAGGRCGGVAVVWRLADRGSGSGSAGDRAGGAFAIGGGAGGGAGLLDGNRADRGHTGRNVVPGDYWIGGATGCAGSDRGAGGSVVGERCGANVSMDGVVVPAG